MVNLVYAVLSIALVSATMFASISYVNSAPSIRKEIEFRLEGGFNSLQAGYTKFVDANTTRPVALSDITPAYAFVPASLWNDTVWYYGTGTSPTSAYFCFYGTFNEVRLGAAKRLFYKFSPQAFFINEACGATSNLYPAPLNGEANLAITLWSSF